MATEPFGREDVEPISEETAFDGFWPLKVMRLRHRRFAGGWSEDIRREVHIRGTAVGVLLYDPELDAVGLIEQFRVGAWAHGDQPWMLEIVAGLLEPGEQPEDVARRESLEEAGCAVGELEPIARFFPSPGGCDEYCHLFCARADLSDVRSIHGVAHEHEDIRLHVLPWQDVEARLITGELNNAFVLIAAFWLQNHRERLRARWLEQHV